MPPILEIHIVPVGTAQASMGELVARTVRIAKEQGLRYQVNPMGTSLEGSLDALFAVARAMHEAAFAQGAPRVITSMRLDDRRDKELSMEYKVQSVLEKLGNTA